MALGALYGASGIEEEARKRIMARLAEQQMQQQMDLAMRGADRADQQLQQQGEYQKAQLESLNLLRQAQADAASEQSVSRLSGLLTPGQTMAGDTADKLPDYLKQAEPQRELAAPPGIAMGEQGQAIPGTVANSPSIVGRKFVYTGTGPQQVAQNRQKAIQQRIDSLPEGDRERKLLEYNLLTGGDNAPTSLFEPPTKAEGKHYLLTTKDGKKVEIQGQENEQGRVTYQNEDVTDRVVPYTQPHDTSFRSDARSDRSYNYNRTALDKVSTPLEDQQRRMSRLVDALNEGTPTSVALVAPELLTVMAGGTGSGLRMSEAELGRIIGGRSKLQDLKVMFQKWSLDPKSATGMTPEQLADVRALVTAVGEKSNHALAIVNAAGDALADPNNDDPTAHRRIVADAKKKLQQIYEVQTETKTPGGVEQWHRDPKTGQLVKGPAGAK